VRLIALEETTANGAGDLAAARWEANELRGELGAAQGVLADFDLLRRRAEAELNASQTVVDEQRGDIATLEMRLAALEVRFADVERSAAAAAERAAGERDRLRAALADSEARLARSEEAREEAVLENRRQFERLAGRGGARAQAETTERADPENAPAAANADRDKALRAAISRIGRDVARLEKRRRAAEAEPINLAAPLHPAPVGKIRQGEPAAREG